MNIQQFPGQPRNAWLLLDFNPKDSGPEFFRMEIRKYLDGRKNTYYIVFCAFHNGSIRSKKQEKYPSILRILIHICSGFFDPDISGLISIKYMDMNPVPQDFFTVCVKPPTRASV